MMLKTYATHFCGIGGACLGMEQAGLQCVHAIEWMKPQIEYREKNLGHRAVHADITEYKFRKSDAADVLWTSPPCQAFSSAGREQNLAAHESGDEDVQEEFVFKENLFLSSIRYVEQLKPRFVVLENVTGLLSHKSERGEPTLLRMINTFKDIGYHVEYNVLNAKYLLPQDRERVFLVCSRDGETGLIPLEDTGASPRFADIMEHGVKRYCYDNTVVNKVMTNTYRTVYECVARNSRKNKQEYRFSVIGNDEASASILPTITCAWGGGATRKKVAIVDHADGLCFLRHPTPREGARAQGFPDSWVLPESDHLAWEMIGNAVPVQVARSIAWHLKSIASGAKPPAKRALTGKRIPKYAQQYSEGQPAFTFG
jgi:DNA (cytosine-5)-methyltransferase 1